MHVSNHGGAAALRGAGAPEASGITRTLRRGSSGGDVRELQQLLADVGQSVDVDGRFGPQTEAAVRRFQSDEHIASDGIVGPVTLDRLRNPTTTSSAVDAMDRAPRGPQSPVALPPMEPRTPPPPTVTPRRGLSPTDSQTTAPTEPTSLPLGVHQTEGGAVRVRDDATAAGLRATSPEHAALVDEMREQGFFPVRTADGGHVFMSNPSYDADRNGGGVSSREAEQYAVDHGLRLPTRAEADAFRAQAPVVMQFESGPTPGTSNARSGDEQAQRIAARLQEVGVPESGVAIAGGTKIWALDPGRQPGLNGGVTNVNSGAALQRYSTVHGPDYEDYSQAAQFVADVRVAPDGTIVR